jgi:hypothetical protein
MKDFVAGTCKYHDALSSQNMQVNHFIARFKRAMKESNSFYMDNLGHRFDYVGLSDWNTYTTFDELLAANREIVSTGDVTHYFRFDRDEVSGKEYFTVSEAQ